MPEWFDAGWHHRHRRDFAQARIEIHGTKGTTSMTGDKLTAWDVQDDLHHHPGDPPPLSASAASGASDPMAISVEPFERQFHDFAAAIHVRRAPRVSGEDVYRALEMVDAVYRRCREGHKINLDE